jgi:spore coat protein U-like protein
MNTKLNAMMKANSTKLMLAVLLTLSFGVAHAGTATATLGVSATVTANCTITTTPVGFGSYDPVSGATDYTAQGTVVVACTKNSTGLSVGIDNGANYASTTRNMLGAARADKLAYSVVQPTTGTTCPAYGAGTAWNTTSGALALASPTGKAARTYGVCGQLAKGQDVSVDTYSDTVTATINF